MRLLSSNYHWRKLRSKRFIIDDETQQIIIITGPNMAGNLPIAANGTD
jgi:hypothetical protein